MSVSSCVTLTSYELPKYLYKIFIENLNEIFFYYYYYYKAYRVILDN